MFEKMFGWIFYMFPSNKENFVQQHNAHFNRLRKKMDEVDKQVEMSEYNPTACSQFNNHDRVSEGFQLLSVDFVADPVFPDAVVQEEDLIGDEWMDYPPPK